MSLRRRCVKKRSEVDTLVRAGAAANEVARANAPAAGPGARATHACQWRWRWRSTRRGARRAADPEARRGRVDREYADRRSRVRRSRVRKSRIRKSQIRRSQIRRSRVRRQRAPPPRATNRAVATRRRATRERAWRHAQTMLGEPHAADGRGLPRHVEREVAEYLRCGLRHPRPRLRPRLISDNYFCRSTTIRFAGSSTSG